MGGDDLMALTARIRAGDAEAAAEFVRRFEPQIRRLIRIHGTGQPLQRVLDSDDVCQSVLRRFLGELGKPTMPADDPGKLLAWLVAVAKNRRREALRRERADKRGGGRVREIDTEVFTQQADPSPAVGLELEQRELLEAILARLSERDRQIARLRADDVSWEEIARQLGGNAEALRKSYRRAVRRAVEADDSQP